MSKDTFRLRVLKALTEVLEQIGQKTGYGTEMVGRVHRGRLLYGNETDIPFISILEAPIPKDTIPTPGANPNSYGKWELLIQGFVKDDRKNPTDPAHELMGNVKAILAEEMMKNKSFSMLHIGDDKYQIKTRIREMNIGQGSVRPPDEITDKAYFWLTLTLSVAETLNKPYD